MVLRAYKYRLYPNAAQQDAMIGTMHACRYVYNWALEQSIHAREAGEKRPSAVDLNKRLTMLKAEKPWLYEYSNAALQYAIRHLDTAYANFFRGLKTGQPVGPPTFKKKHTSRKSYQVIGVYSIDVDANRVKLPKIPDPVKAVIDRPIPGTQRTATVSRTSTGRFFISVLAEDGVGIPESKGYTADTTVGIDLGLLTLVTLSTGEKVENPRHFRNAEKRIAVLKRRASRKQTGSANHRKANLCVARAEELVANQRAHHRHNLSRRLVTEYDAIAVEDLNIVEMVQDPTLAKSISDASWGEFVRQLEYKCRWAGKNLLRIGRFDPSSKTCSACGHVIATLPLAVRAWVCPACGAEHDRDLNASINIKQMALEQAGRNPPGEPVDSRKGRGMKQEPAHTYIDQQTASSAGT